MSVSTPAQLPLSKLRQEFYTRDDVVEVARDLLGKVLCSKFDGRLTKAVITETEAYAGIDDRASHAYGGRRTKRTESPPATSNPRSSPMLGPGRPRSLWPRRWFSPGRVGGRSGWPFRVFIAGTMDHVAVGSVDWHPARMHQTNCFHQVRRLNLQRSSPRVQVESDLRKSARKCG